MTQSDEKTNIVHADVREWSQDTGTQSPAALARRGYLRNVYMIEWARPGLSIVQDKRPAR